ncbi:MAG: hypothetical protein PVF18_07815, partial [Anaerolineales bacterium]
ELEALVEPSEEGSYPIHLSDGMIDHAPLVQAIIDELRNGVEHGVIAARFHQSLVEVIGQICISVRAEAQIDQVVLSGGVWQNKVLLERTIKHLESEDFQVLRHRKIPANDGGLALGQAVIAAAKTGAL